MKWFKVVDDLPQAFMTVLGWDRFRGFTICSWIQRPDCKDGEMWVVNGSSGGLGTSIEVKPPSYWCRLPMSPE